MTLEQKSQLNELLEALKTADKDLEIYLEAENQGLISGDASIEYKRGSIVFILIENLSFIPKL